MFSVFSLRNRGQHHMVKKKKKCEVKGGAGRRKGPLCNLSPTQMEELCLPPIPRVMGGGGGQLEKWGACCLEIAPLLPYSSNSEERVYLK